jgi:hypothetical protein
MRQHQDRAALAAAFRPCQHCQRDRAQDTTSVTPASRADGLVIPGGPKATFDRMRALKAKLTIYRTIRKSRTSTLPGECDLLPVLTRTDASQMTSTAEFGRRSVTGDALAQGRLDRGRRPYANRAERPKDARNRLIWVWTLRRPTQFACTPNRPSPRRGGDITVLRYQRWSTPDDQDPPFGGVS